MQVPARAVLPHAQWCGGTLAGHGAGVGPCVQVGGCVGALAGRVSAQVGGQRARGLARGERKGVGPERRGGRTT